MTSCFHGRESGHPGRRGTIYVIDNSEIKRLVRHYIVSSRHCRTKKTGQGFDAWPGIRIICLAVQEKLFGLKLDTTVELTAFLGRVVILGLGFAVTNSFQARFRDTIGNQPVLHRSGTALGEALVVDFRPG